jgi:pyruvate dehydrogenase (quinone)
MPDPASVQELADAINAAGKVAIFAGAGVEGAHDEVIALAGLIAAPIGHSLRGKDFMQYDNAYDIGMTGLLGYGAAAEGIEDADLLILLGTDFPYDQFLPGTRTAQVDRAAHRLGRRTGVVVAVHGDVLPTLAALMPLV